MSQRVRQAHLWRTSAWGLLLAGVAACGTDGTTQPGSVRFGQLGEIRATVVAPLIIVDGTNVRVAGEIQQILTWNSTGPWQLYESVSYQGRIGDETLRRSQGDPSQFAAAYASLITQLSDTDALKLSVAGLDPNLVVNCEEAEGGSRSLVSFQIRDEFRDETRKWSRCAEGSLEELRPETAGPDSLASRVIQASVLARDFALGTTYQSPYLGTLPFGTLDKGEESSADLSQPLIFRGGEGPNTFANPDSAFRAFWVEHAPGTPVPEVDWRDEMVLVGGLGEVTEAGDSVEVRRIIQDVLGTTLVELVNRVPGDFCSPASRRHTPFHVVVAPLRKTVVRFASPRTELVPCVL